GYPEDANSASTKNSASETIVVQFDLVDDTAHTVNISGVTTSVPAGQDVVLTITDQYGNDVTLTVQVDGGGAYTATLVDVSTLADGPLTVLAQTEDQNGAVISDTDTAELDAVPG